MEKQQDLFKIQTPNTYPGNPEDSQPAKLTHISGEERVWLNSLYTHGYNFVTAYIPKVHKPSLQDYERAHLKYNQSPSPKHTKQQVVIALTAGLSAQCSKSLDTEWVKVVAGTEAEYVIMSKKVEIFLCPFTDTERLISANAVNFLSEIYKRFADAIASNSYPLRTHMTFPNS